MATFGPIASKIAGQMAQSQIGLGNRGSSRFVIGARSTPSGPLARLLGADGAPQLTFQLVAQPLLDEIDEMNKVGIPGITARWIKKTVLDILVLVKPATPLDTGLARDTWQVATNLVRAIRVPRVAKLTETFRDPPGGAIYSYGVGSYVGLENGLNFARPYIRIWNNLKYIMALEYGWSIQAPFGMLRVSVARVAGFKPTEIGRMVGAYWYTLMDSAARKAGRQVRGYANKFTGTNIISRGGITY